MLSLLASALHAPLKHAIESRISTIWPSMIPHPILNAFHSYPSLVLLHPSCSTDYPSRSILPPFAMLAALLLIETQT